MLILFGKEKLKELDKENYKYVLLSVLPTLVFVTIVVLLFVFSTRELRRVFPIILSIVSTIYATYILYLSFVSLRKHLAYRKKCKEASQKSVVECDATVLKIEEKATTIDKICCYGVHFLLIDENEEAIRYVPTSDISLFEEGKTYIIRILHQFVVGVEEKKND